MSGKGDRKQEYFKHLFETVKTHLHIELPRPAAGWSEKTWCKYIDDVRPVELKRTGARNSRIDPRAPPPSRSTKAALLAAAAWITKIDPFVSAGPAPKLKALPGKVSRTFDHRDKDIAYINLHKHRNAHAARLRLAQEADTPRHSPAPPSSLFFRLAIPLAILLAFLPGRGRGALGDASFQPSQSSASDQTHPAIADTSFRLDKDGLPRDQDLRRKKRSKSAKKRFNRATRKMLERHGHKMKQLDSIAILFLLESHILGSLVHRASTSHGSRLVPPYLFRLLYSIASRRPERRVRITPGTWAFEEWRTGFPEIGCIYHLSILPLPDVLSIGCDGPLFQSRGGCIQCVLLDYRLSLSGMDALDPGDVYLEHGCLPPFLPKAIFLRIFFLFHPLQQRPASFSCPRCGPPQDVLIADGVFLAHTLRDGSDLCPPTLPGPISNLLPSPGQFKPFLPTRTARTALRSLARQLSSSSSPVQGL
ncbi:hypothetical protein V8E36_007534 [Tilletia maclaganii]